MDGRSIGSSSTTSAKEKSKYAIACVIAVSVVAVRLALVLRSVPVLSQVKEHEQRVSQLHAETTARGGIDAYVNYRVGFSVHTLEPYVERLSANNQSHSLSSDGRRMLVYAPNGYTFELFLEIGRAHV